jgi:hypothetical protein
LKIRIEQHLTPFFAGRRMNSITTADVRAYSKQRIDVGAKPATVNRELSALRRMFTLAVKAGKLMVRPHMPMLAENYVRTGFFERETFEAVRAALPEDLRPIATFAYLTGWRLSEILSLQWRQVDLQIGTVRLDPGTTKNRDSRLFPYRHHLPELREVLEAQRRATTAVETSADVICQVGPSIAAEGAYGACEAPGRPPVRRPAVPACCGTTSGVQPCGTSSARACRAVWRCNSPDTGPKRSTAGTRSSASRTSAKASKSSVNSGQGQSRGQNGGVLAYGSSRKREILRILFTPGWRNWQTHRT